MIILDTPQGTLDWITERLWRLTGSGLKPVITSTGALSKSQASIAAIDKLIAGLDAANEIRTNPSVLDNLDDYQVQEWLSHYTGEKFSGNRHTRRGNDLEPDALAALSERIGMQIDPVGMCIMGDDPNGVVSCSPDGLIYRDGQLLTGAECKARHLATYYNHVADGVLPEGDKHQVHAEMAICEVDEWHYGSYFPGKPIFHVLVRRDKFTDTLEQSLMDFRAMYEARFMAVTEAMERLSENVEVSHRDRERQTAADQPSEQP